jgi:hypothetical protein
MSEALYKADPAKGQHFDKLTFIWEKGGIWYALSGSHSGALDEAALVKMACSIRIE